MICSDSQATAATKQKEGSNPPAEHWSGAGSLRLGGDPDPAETSSHLARSTGSGVGRAVYAQISGVHRRTDRAYCPVRQRSG